MANSRITQLAQSIATNTASIDAFIKENDLAQPSFNADGLGALIKEATPEITKAKNDVIEASIELRQLLEGPMKLLLPESNFAPLAAVYRFKLASFVPLDSSISFTDVAKKSGLQEHDLRRIIRYTAAHHRVFREPEKGYVTHTAASRFLLENPVAGDLMGLTFEECWPAHGRAVDAMAQQSEEPNMSGYALANSSTLNMFEFLEQNPLRAKRFAGAMSSTSPASLKALCDYFDWAGLPPGSTVVDIGGSQGHVSFHLARAFPHLKFVVQDLPAVIKGAEEAIPEDVKDRVQLTAHSMFTEQSVKGAAVYLLRFVLHDWPDKYCIEILRKLVPSVHKGAKVVIQDHLLPEPGTLSLLQEMQIRSMDAIMLSLFNSRERDEDDWRDLFSAADKGFTGFRATRVKENPSTGLMIAEWQ